jgi:phosphosulfolactate synthase (CoM biosynthesis protein A)
MGGIAARATLAGHRSEVETACDRLPAHVVQLARFVLPLGKVMFEAADPEVFGWYVKNYGPEVNLFVDHSQIVQLESLPRGNWGTKSLWGRVVTYPGSERR